MFRDNDDSTRSQINSAYYSNAVVDQRNIARNQNKKLQSTIRWGRYIESVS